MQSCPLHGEFPVKLDISGLCRAGWHAVAPVGAPIKTQIYATAIVKKIDVKQKLRIQIDWTFWTPHKISTKR